MKTKVLTQEEITQLKKTQQDKIVLIEQFGIIELQFQELKDLKKQLEQRFLDSKQQEEQLGKQLQTKYGNGSIDLEKGMFISD